MKRITKTILEEITSIVPGCDRALIIDSRGNHIIKSAINLLESIESQFGGQVREEMERRLINSIRARNAAKFTRGAKKIIESQKFKLEVVSNANTRTTIST